MKLDDLRRLIETIEPAAVLVPSHVLERLIQQSSGLSGLPWRVPHAECFLIHRQDLFRYAEQDELDLSADRPLPSRVILLARPPADRLASLPDDIVRQTYWRRLLHARVHWEMESRLESISSQELAERIRRLGSVAFQEIRSVLDQDGYLLPGASDRDVYIEFAAVYSEFRAFSPKLLEVYFPGLPSREQVESILVVDIDADTITARTRLPGTPDPIPLNEDQSDEPLDYYRRLDRQADSAAAEGNDVRAAILHTKAARVAPAALTPSTRHDAEKDLKRLVDRLRSALHLSDEQAAGWLNDLPALLDKADQGRYTVEAALLYDLQRACEENEREAYALDVVEWVLSGGRRPMKRALPGLRLIRVTQHLNEAKRRLTAARLADADRKHLGAMLDDAVNGCENRMRNRFRPVLTDAFNDAGLRPDSLPEQVALAKVIEEILDLIGERGYFSFGDLRDIISRNRLKIRDLSGPKEFMRGDPLLTLDHRLASALDGVYRRADFYLRWLHRGTALCFGTRLGRAITRYLTIPFGGAFLLLEGSQLAATHLPGFGAIPPLVTWPNWLATGLFLLALVMFAVLRRWLALGGERLWQTMRRVFYDVPAAILGHPWTRRFLASWPVQLGYHYLLKPGLVCTPIWLNWPTTFWHWPSAIGLVLLASFLLNSRAGLASQEALARVVVSLSSALMAGLVPATIRWTLHLFKQLLGLVEATTHLVDEWLRLRSGDRLTSQVLRAILGVLWFPLGYLLRFYLVVLIEPGFNPVKFPLSVIAAKFVYPIVLGMELPGSLTGFLAPVLGTVASGVLVGVTIWLLPDAIVFLIWETKENWSLYRANRSRELQPSTVGRHGETIKTLLKPGFHSGTVPRLFARLRSAERKAAEDGDWRTVRTYRDQLRDTESALRRFVGRELIALLELHPVWKGLLSIEGVKLANNAITIALRHTQFSDRPLIVCGTLQEGWLVGSLVDRAWFVDLPPKQAISLANALAGLCKLSGMDFIEAHLQAGLGGRPFAWHRRGLMLWTERGEALFYDPCDRGPRLWPRDEAFRYVDGPILETTRVVFGRVPLEWDEWEAIWAEDAASSLPTAAALALQLLKPPAEAHEGRETRESNGWLLPVLDERSA